MSGNRIVCSYCMRVFYDEKDFAHHRKVIHDIDKMTFTVRITDKLTWRIHSKELDFEDFDKASEYYDSIHPETGRTVELLEDDQVLLEKDWS